LEQSGTAIVQTYAISIGRARKSLPFSNDAEVGVFLWEKICFGFLAVPEIQQTAWDAETLFERVGSVSFSDGAIHCMRVKRPHPPRVELVEFYVI